MDAIDVNWLASLGVGGALAWGMFLVYRKDLKQVADERKEQMAAMAHMLRDNTQAMRDNTQALAALKTLIEDRLDR